MLRSITLDEVEIKYLNNLLDTMISSTNKSISNNNISKKRGKAVIDMCKGIKNKLSGGNNETK